MKIPKSIKVGAYTYKIVKRKNIQHEGKDLSGLCAHDEFTIFLDSSLKGVDLSVVFLHECIHAIEYCYSIKLTEQIVQTLDHALIALINDNELSF